jgi:hypothetical protein
MLDKSKCKTDTNGVLALTTTASVFHISHHLPMITNQTQDGGLKYNAESMFLAEIWDLDDYHRPTGGWDVPGPARHMPYREAKKSNDSHVAF